MPRKLLTSFVVALGLNLSAAVGHSAGPEIRLVEVPGIGTVEFPREMSAQRIEQVLNTNLAFRVDAQSFKVSVVVSPQRAVAPAAAVAPPQPAPTQTGSSNPIPVKVPPSETGGSFVAFLSVVVLVVSIVLHLRRRSTTGTKAVPAPTVSVTPVQPQPLTLYVLVNGNTQGPLSQDQVLDMMQQGQLLGETPAWKEGLADWKRLDQLVSLPPMPPVPPAVPQGTSAAADVCWSNVVLGIIGGVLFLAFFFSDISSTYFGLAVGFYAFCLLFRVAFPTPKDRESLWVLTHNTGGFVSVILIVALQLFLVGAGCWLAIKFFKWVLSLF